jgi:hypothetical protein
MARKEIPKRAKPEEKEKTSAQCPRAEGTTPPPKINPIIITRETATPLRGAGKTREMIVNPTGNRHATDAAWRNIRTTVPTGFRKAPKKTVRIPVVRRKTVIALLGPNRSVMNPDRKRITIPKTRENPMRVLAVVLSIPISFTRKRGIMVYNPTLEPMDTTKKEAMTQ